MYYFIKLHTVPQLCFNEAHKAIVHKAIVEVAEHWKYDVHALQVFDGGVHLLVSRGGREIKFVMTGMKAWSTRSLRENRTIGAKQPVWIKGGDIVPVEDSAGFERIRLLIEQEEIEESTI
jgi:REP element-mobilizing transposase RayT